MRAEPSPTDVVQNDRSVRSTSVDNVSQCNAQPGQRQRARDSSTRRVMTPGPSSSDVVMCRLRSAVEVAGAVACAPPNVGQRSSRRDGRRTPHWLQPRMPSLEASERAHVALQWWSCITTASSMGVLPTCAMHTHNSPASHRNWWWPRCWRILRAKGAPLLKIARGHGLSEKEDPYTHTSLESSHTGAHHCMHARALSLTQRNSEGRNEKKSLSNPTSADPTRPCRGSILAVPPCGPCLKSQQPTVMRGGPPPAPPTPRRGPARKVENWASHYREQTLGRY